MSHRRKESDAPSFDHEASRFQTLLESIRLHIRLTLVKFHQFWYYTDTPGKMDMAKRFLRTKQILIFITSVLFIFGTSWFATHPDVHPLVPEHHRVVMVPAIEPFPHETRELIDKFDLGMDKLRVIDSFEATDIKEFVKPNWQLDLPPWANTSNPAIVTAVFEYKGFERLLKMIFTVQQFAADNHLAIFDMTNNARDARKNGGDFRNRETIETYCNITQVCSIHGDLPFSLPHMPKFIQKETIGAYKPIFIQKMLKEFPMVMWMDSNGLIPPTGLQRVWNRTQLNKVSTWQLENGCAASSYTFQKMLPYFGLRLEDLHFNHMIESGSYAFLRTSPGMNQLLHLWLNCSLTERCINPIGCDSSNCPHLSCRNEQPTFNYMGCHKYETSALTACLRKLQYGKYDAAHKEYPLADLDTLDSADIGYNISAIKTNISIERNRMMKSTSRRKVNLLQPF